MGKAGRVATWVMRSVTLVNMTRRLSSPPSCSTFPVSWGIMHGEGSACGNLGAIFGGLGQYYVKARSVEFSTEQLNISRELGTELGKALHMATTCSLGQFDKAIESSTEQLTIFRELGDRAGAN